MWQWQASWELPAAQLDGAQSECVWHPRPICLPAVMRSPRAPCTSDIMHSNTAPAFEQGIDVRVMQLCSLHKALHHMCCWGESKALVLMPCKPGPAGCELLPVWLKPSAAREPGGTRQPQVLWKCASAASRAQAGSHNKSHKAHRASSPGASWPPPLKSLPPPPAGWRCTARGREGHKARRLRCWKE